MPTAKKKPSPKIQKPENLKPQIVTLNAQVEALTGKVSAIIKAVISLASTVDISQSAVQHAIEKRRSLQEKVGDHIMLDLLQQTQLPDKLTLQQRWDRILYAVESAVKEYSQTDQKYEWDNIDGIADIHKTLQMLSGESNE